MRILVVEDEADLNLLLCKVLTRAGYTVDGCMDGEEAELHLMGAEYDGILLDVMLPKKDGYTLVQELRARGGHTGALPHRRDSVADRVRGLDLGGDDYLVKPFDFDELLARIRAMTRKHAASAPIASPRRPGAGCGGTAGDPGRGGDPPAAQGVLHPGVPDAQQGEGGLPGAD